MTVYVLRNGQLVNKAEHLYAGQVTVDFPTPNISRMEPFESPVTGKTINTWRERDADMKAADAYDKRDFKTPPRKHDGPRQPDPGQLDLPFWR